MDITAFNTLIKERRSVFARQLVPGKTIDNAIIEQMLENARWAPTHKLTEPWRFKVYTGDGLATFAAQHAAAYKALAGDKFSEQKFQKVSTPPQGSHLILIGVQKSGMVPFIEEIAAVACAVENMYLTCTAYQVGGYWSTGGVSIHEQAGPYFGWDDTCQPFGYFLVGEIAVPSPAGKRKPVEELTEWIYE